MWTVFCSPLAGVCLHRPTPTALASIPSISFLAVVPRNIVPARSMTSGSTSTPLRLRRSSRSTPLPVLRRFGILPPLGDCAREEPRVVCRRVLTCALPIRSEEHTSELQSLRHLVCCLLLEKKKVRQHGTRVEATRTDLL